MLLALPAGCTGPDRGPSDGRSRPNGQPVDTHVGAANTAPSAEILALPEGGAHPEGARLVVAGRVRDAEDPASALVVWWESSLDGALLAPAPATKDGDVRGELALSPGFHQVTLWVEDPAGARGSDRGALTVAANSPPTITWASPIDGTVVNAEEPVLLRAEVADAEQVPQSLTVTWTSDVDGLLATGVADPTGLAEVVVALSPGPHFLSTTVTDAHGLSAEDRVLVFANQVPTVPKVAVEPSDPTTEDDLIGTLIEAARDPEGDAITYTWAWLVDGAPGPVGETVLAEDTTAGQDWELVVTPSDPFGAGPPGRAVVTIGVSEGRAPEIGEVELSPALPRTNDVVWASASIADPDGDEVNVVRRWYVDGVELPVAGPALDGALWFDKHQLVWVEVEADDGVHFSGPVASAPVEVRNTPPSEPTIRITPTEPAEDEDLWCAVTRPSTDDDGDPLTYRFEWDVAGEPFLDAIQTELPGDTVLADDTACGERWSCVSFAEDGETPGAAAANTAEIGGWLADFGPPVEVGNGAYHLLSVFATDLDDDGDVDVLSGADTPSGEVLWYENLGEGVFRVPQVISRDVSAATSVFAADLDGDSDADVLSASFSGDEVWWTENLGGGNFSEIQHVLSTSADGAWSVFATDLDGDGDTDVLSASGYDDKVAWYENLGGTFTGEKIIDSGADGAYSVVGTDLDGDGDADVLASLLFEDLVVWYENLGGAFGPAQQIHLAPSPYYIGIFAADLDGDHDPDVLATDHAADSVLWFENVGGGSFSPGKLVGRTQGPWSVYATDFDGDLDVDVVASSPSTVTWYENLGRANFGVAQVIEGSADTAWSVFATDLDGDLDADVLSGSRNTLGVVAWYRNLGGAFGDALRLSTASGPASVTASDMDTDGDTDLLSAGLPVAWYENWGGGVFSYHVLDDSYRVSEVLAEDLDADGDPDVVYGGANVWWRENLGGDAFGPPSVVAANARADALVAADLDADRDLDLLSASLFHLEITAYENLGGGAFAAGRALVGGIDAASIFVADLDDDGDVDLLAGSYHRDRVVWFENLGSWPYGTEREISALADGPRSVMAADLDQDGDQDVVSASSEDDTVAWYENLGGGAFGVENVLTESADRAESVYAADLDRDGDVDVMVASCGDGSAWWFQNLGDGVFGSPLLVASAAECGSSIHAADLDGDGALEVLVADLGAGSVAWYPNTLVCP